jgi:hypothetical protein
LHVSFNNNCQSLNAILFWNAIDTGGTVAAPQSLATLPVSYTNAAFTTPLPAPVGLWVVDAACATRCGIPTNATVTKADAIKAKLQTAAGMIPAAEQVAATKAATTKAAMFGAGVKESVENGITSVLNAAGTNKTMLG